MAQNGYGYQVARTVEVKAIKAENYVQLTSTFHDLFSTFTCSQVNQAISQLKYAKKVAIRR